MKTGEKRRAGPWRDDGVGGLEAFDIDADGFVDEGARIGVALNHPQHYSYQIQIEQCGDSVGLVYLDTISTQSV